MQPGLDANKHRSLHCWPEPSTTGAVVPIHRNYPCQFRANWKMFLVHLKTNVFPMVTDPHFLTRMRWPDHRLHVLGALISQPPSGPGAKTPTPRWLCQFNLCSPVPLGTKNPEHSLAFVEICVRACHGSTFGTGGPHTICCGFGVDACVWSSCCASMGLSSFALRLQHATQNGAVTCGLRVQNGGWPAGTRNCSSPTTPTIALVGAGPACLIYRIASEGARALARRGRWAWV